MNEKEYIEDYLRVIDGGKIVQVGVHEDENEPYLGYWPIFWVEDKSGKTWQVRVSCDPEGNGPGHLAIEEAEAI